MRRVTAGRLRAASLVEAVVASIVLLVAFAATMELLPRLSVHDDDAEAVAEAEYRAAGAFAKYSSGLWPEGTYVESCDGGRTTVRVEPYRDYGDMQLITVVASIYGRTKQVVHKQVVVCGE